MFLLHVFILSYFSFEFVHPHPGLIAQADEEAKAAAHPTRPPPIPANLLEKASLAVHAAGALHLTSFVFYLFRLSTPSVYLFVSCSVDWCLSR
jgi:hypothetical protein